MYFFTYCNPNHATEEMIAALEERFRLRLPADMREWYLSHNGAAFSGCRAPEHELLLRSIYPIGASWAECVLTMDKLLEWQQMDGFIPMWLVPFCEDEAGDSYYIRVDEAGYGKIYYLFSEFLDDFLEEMEDSLVADSFSAFLERLDPAEKKFQTL